MLAGQGVEVNATGDVGRAGAANSPVELSTAPPRKLYRYYVLAALLVVTTFNFMDRAIVGIVQEPLKHEFGLSDFQLGLLGGPAFAVLYVAMGFPMAWLAERRRRATIIAVVLALWSAMTAVCGLAANYGQMLAARVGVSIGEAGGAPASQSMIADYFGRDERATAYGVYGLGTPIGSLLAAFGGGLLVQTFGWRATFIVFGVAGILFALVFALTVREPTRSAHATTVPPLSQTLRFLFGKRAFRHVVAGNTLAVFTLFTLQQYMVSFFVRRFGLDLIQGSMLLGLIGGVAAAAGTFLGGYMADRLSSRGPVFLARVPMTGFLIAFPFYFAAFLLPSLELVVGLLLVASFFHFFYLGPSYAIVQGVAEPRMRAMAAAILLFVVNLLGAGVGPPVLGALSDQLTAAGIGLPTAGKGLPVAMAIFSIGNLWAAFHFYRAGTTVEVDLVEEVGHFQPARTGSGQ